VSVEVRETVGRGLGLALAALALQLVAVGLISLAAVPSTNETNEVLGDSPSSVTRLVMHELLERVQLRRTVDLLAISQVRADGCLENWQAARVPFAEET
jgi:hypothetical protein